MSGSFRFLSLVQPFMSVLPEVAQAERKIPFRYAQWDDWQWTNEATGKNMDIPGIVNFPPDKHARRRSGTT